MRPTRPTRRIAGSSAPRPMYEEASGISGAEVTFRISNAAPQLTGRAGRAYLSGLPEPTLPHAREHRQPNSRFADHSSVAIARRNTITRATLAACSMHAHTNLTRPSLPGLQTRRPCVRRLFVLFGLLFMGVYATEAPIRYNLHLIGADDMIFVRDFLLVVPLAALFVSQAFAFRNHPAYWAFLAIVLLHGSISYFNFHT